MRSMAVVGSYAIGNPVTAENMAQRFDLEKHWRIVRVKVTLAGLLLQTYQIRIKHHVNPWVDYRIKG
jgi:hypothetical protein